MARPIHGRVRSVAMAVSTSSRPLGAPGSTAARTPITTAQAEEDDQLGPGDADHVQPLVAHGVHHRHAEADAERDAEHGPEHGDHHGLEGDHQAQLAAAEPDRAQQPDLAGALDDRQRQRVHDAEHRDHQRQPEQGVDHQHQLVDRRPLLGRRTAARP